MTGIRVLREDVNDDAILPQMYQQDEEDICAVTNIVDAGTMLQVKVPYYKFTSSRNYGLRVDHLSDVVRIDKNDLMVPKGWIPRLFKIEDSAESFKSKGNQSLKKAD
jgi:hypothetical protein